MVNEVGEEWKDDKDIDDGSRKEVTNDPPHGPAGNRLNRQVIHFLSSYIILVSSKISPTFGSFTTMFITHSLRFLYYITPLIL